MPQEAFRLTLQSPESSLWTSVFRRESRLRLRRLLELGGSDRQLPRFCSGAAFFSTAGRLVLPLSFSFGLDRRHAHDGVGVCGKGEALRALSQAGYVGCGALQVESQVRRDDSVRTTAFEGLGG